MAKNWFKKLKISQSIFPGTEITDDEDIKKGPGPATPRWRKGQRVRDRRKGMANPQEYGIIDKIEGNKIKIVWNTKDKDKNRTDILDMVEDAQILAYLITEV